MSPSQKGYVKTVLLMFMAMYPLSYIWRSPAMADLAKAIGWIIRNDSFGPTIYDAVTGEVLENTFDER